MSRRSDILLHKKLSELESELAVAFRLPPHSVSDQKFSRRLRKRFDYINNLLSAEVASTPEKTDQLHEISDKLTGLEAAFACWTQYRAFAHDMYHDDDATVSVYSHCMDDDVVDGDGQDSPQLSADHFAGGMEREECRRSWGGFGKLCGAFGSGVMVGVVWCTTIVDFASFYLLQYQDLHFIPPT